MNVCFFVRLWGVLSAIMIAGASQAQLLNGDFTQVGPNGNPSTSIGPTNGQTANWSAAAHWFQFVPAPGGVLTTEIVDGFGPGESNALHVTTTTGDYGSYGAGIGQGIGLKPWAVFSCDIYVVQGTIWGGLVTMMGWYADQTSYSPTGQWVHIHQTYDSSTQTVSFEDLQSTNSPADFYIANASLQTVPEPITVALALAGLGLAMLRRRT